MLLFFKENNDKINFLKLNLNNNLKVVNKD